MKMSQKPLTPWVVAEETGKIITSHCDCMAGLGESRSHVASPLWAVESGLCIRDSMTVTEKKAYWICKYSDTWKQIVQKSTVFCQMFVTHCLPILLK